MISPYIDIEDVAVADEPECTWSQWRDEGLITGGLAGGTVEEAIHCLEAAAECLRQAARQLRAGERL